MKSRALAVLVAIALLVLPGTALAQEDEPPPVPEPTDGWVDSADIPTETDLAFCGTTLTLSFPPEGDTVEEWVTLDERGNTHIAFRGQSIVDIEAADGRRALLDISGPGETILYPNGDVYFSARGESIIYAVTDKQKAAAAEAGLPEIFWFADPESSFAVYFTAPPEDGPEDAEGTETVTLLPDPDEIIDVCDLLVQP